MLAGHHAGAQTPAERPMSRDILTLSPPPADARISYGEDPLQFAELRVPAGKGPHPAAIVIHGGYWRAAYDLTHAGHMCAALTKAGVATWSLEYRRIGNPGGGWPGTGADVVRGADHLAKIAAAHQLDLRRTAAIGHSAGGHLVLWLASQRKNLRGVVSLAGVSDLRRAFELHLSNTVVADFLGGSPEQVPERYREASPIEHLPLGVPQRLLHGTADDVVPFEISRRYQAAAAAKGDDARLIPLAGAGHFELIDPRSREWPTVQDTLLALVR